MCCLGIFALLRKRSLTIRLKGRVLGIRASDREVLCTKNVLPVPQGASGKLPFSPGRNKNLLRQLLGDRTKLPADYYSRTTQSIYLSRFRAIISPGHKLQCELPLSTSSLSVLNPYRVCCSSHWSNTKGNQREKLAADMTWKTFFLLPSQRH